MESYMTKTTTQKTIGYRIKAAREAMSLTQVQLADALALNDRQSISDIEKGKRSIKPDELVLLTEILNKDVEFFLDPFCVAGEAQFSWRASRKIAEDSLNDFEINAGKLIGLLRWLRESEGAANPLKRSLWLTKQSSFEDAQLSAESLVKKFNLGEVPANSLIDFVENKLDIPILFVDTIETPDGDSISGAACHLQDFGVILVNRKESEARCYYDIAHELFHVLTWDAMKPDHQESNSFEERVRSNRIEQLADNFAAALLMPKSTLEKLITNNRSNDIEYLASVATKLKVSPVALAWRLFNLKFINTDTLESLKRVRISSTISSKNLSLSFIKLLYDAIDHGRLSARKAAKAMSMDLTQLKNLFSEYSLATPFDL
jgi:Zn-dependent peptidase ImmA (M78 family)/transcriptional regulator with XRE-family HTH domain